MSVARARGIARLVALLVLATLLGLAARRLDITRVIEELSRVRPVWIALALVGYFAILPLWALQWSLLAAAGPRARPAIRRMLGVVAMTSSVLNTTPLLVGEAAGIYFLVTCAALERGAALSVLAMDQLLVGIAKVCVLLAAAWTNELPVWMERGRMALAIGVGVLLLGLLAIAWRSQSLSRLAATVLPARLARLVDTCGAALSPLRSPRRGGGALLLALAKKSAELLAIVCLQHAFGLALPLSSALLVLAALNLATLLPIVPGNVGVYEAAVVLAYGRVGVSPERALGIAVVQHACYFAALALPGYRWLAREAVSRSAAATP
ncbi:MAG: lysylphosphatidylglycerol synthase transmembrane domain-containing protein [Gemmatimonadaceae bacterium]